MNKQIEMFSFIDSVNEAVLNYDVVGLGPNIDTLELLGAIIGEDADLITCAQLKEHGIRQLMEYSVQDFIGEGLSKIEAIRLHASFLLTKKVLSSKKEDSISIKSPGCVYDYLEDLKFEKQEHLVVLFLDTKNQILKRRTIFVGSLNASVVHPREIFKEAVKLSAGSIIMAHNHPSGSPDPSQEDIHVTKRVVEAGKVMGIELLDHLIIGENSFTSLKEKGYL